MPRSEQGTPARADMPVTQQTFQRVPCHPLGLPSMANATQECGWLLAIKACDGARVV